MIFIEFGDIIKKLRIELGLSQRQLAAGICDRAYISNYENNKSTPDSNIWKMLKERLKISEVPILPAEIEAFEEDLRHWYVLIRNRQIEEAKTLQHKFRSAIDRAYSPSLKIFYNLFSAILIFSDNKAKDMQLLIDKAKQLNYAFTFEHEYYYIYCTGLHYMLIGKCQLALKSLLGAIEIGQKISVYETGLYYNTCVLFSQLGYTPSVLVYVNLVWDRARAGFDRSFQIELDILLAISYNKLDHHKLAKELLLNCLYQAQKNKDSSLIGIIHHHLARVYLKLGQADKAFGHFDISMKYCRPGDNAYLNNILHMAYGCTNNKPKAFEYIEYGLSLASTGSIHEILFKSLVCLLNLNSCESADYIQNVTIPTLLTQGMHLKAIDYMLALKDYYKSVHKYKNALKYSEMAYSYYNKLIKGQLDL